MTRRQRAAAPRQDESGRWYFVVDIGRDANGKRRQAKRRGFKTKREAQEALDKLRVSVTEDTYVKPSRQTLGDYTAEWLDAIASTIRPATLSSYRRNLETHVLPRIGGVPLRNIDGARLNQLYAELLRPGANQRSQGEGLSPRTVNYIATILHRAFRDAVRWGRLARNPADLADPPKASAHRPKRKPTWSAEQLADFLYGSESEGDRDFPLWRFLAATGCRRGEALGLRWRNVDLEAGTATIEETVIVVDHEIHFGKPKTAAGARTISLDARTVSALRAHRARRLEERMALGHGQLGGDDLVFAAPTGEPMHPEAASKRFDRRAKRYGLPHIGVHGLRHTWATLALRAGEHPKVVQERLGHSTIAVTLGVYSHVTDGMDGRAADRVAALIDGEAAQR